MKKKVTKLTLKTEPVVSLSKAQSQHVAGGQASRTTSILSDWFCRTAN